ncbi:hypothetical protein AAG906_016760 [Vitis piasezkii]
MEIPHEDQSSHYDHEKDKFAYLSMRDRIELGKGKFNKVNGAKLTSMARRIEEFELRNVHIEAQPQAMPTSFEYINHPNLTSQPQHQPKDKFAYLSMRDRIELGKGKFNKANWVEPMQKIKESVEDRHFGGDCYDNSMDQPSIENHKVQDDKGLPKSFKASTSPGREEKRIPWTKWEGRQFCLGSRGIKHEVGTMLEKIEMEVKQRKQGSQNA